jgi:chemotaxis protein CheX
MNEAVIRAFTTAARDVLSQEIGGPVDLKAPRLQGGPYEVEGITVVVALAQRIQGAVLLGLEKSTAMQYLSNIVGEQVDELDEMALSGIGELGNMIAGAAISRLSEIGYETVLAPPTVYVGGGTISTLTLPRLVFPVVCRFGALDLQLAARIEQ